MAYYTSGQANSFQKVFGISIAPFIDETGFDILKFDSEIVKSGDGSMADALTTTYGETARHLIESLITSTGHPAIRR